MIELYFAPLTRSIRIFWLLEELGLDFDLRPIPFVSAGDEGFVQKTPTGKIPAITVDGSALSESGAIVQHLLEIGDPFQRLSPRIGHPMRRKFLYWLHFTEATAAQPINELIWL
ncbi:MAG: glutathione S-transferase N-terminal domain-containing protein, partial [Pacificimonas sp.]